MKRSRTLKSLFNNSINRLFIFIVLILFVALIFFLSGSLTGKVVSENCTEQEVCVNDTFETCVDSCENVCENVSKEECNPVVSEECNPVETCNNVCQADEAGIETCTEQCSTEDVCQEVTKDVCEQVMVEECNEVCSKVNCTEEIIENCSIQTICVPITEENKSSEEINETNVSLEVIPSEPVTETIPEIVVEENQSSEINTTNETTILPKVVLTDNEINLIKLKTGESVVRTTKSEVVNDRLVVRLEIGNYWIEKSYNYPLSEIEINNQIELDRLELLKKILISTANQNVEEKEEFLKTYEI